MNEKWLKAEVLAKKLIISATLLGAAVLLFTVIPKLLSLLLPFVVGYIISLIASPLTHVFEKIKLHRTLSAIISILMVAAALFGISALVIDKVVSEVYDFSIHMPDIYNSIADTLAGLKIAVADIFALLPWDFSPLALEQAFESFKDTLSSLSATMVEAISSATLNMVKNIPGILIAIVFSVLASYFLIRDKKIVKYKIATFLGEKTTASLREIKSYLSEAVFAYIRAQSILMSITFIEVFIGLSILNVKYSFLFALIIALIDAIPVFGTGTILIPCALYHIITGNFPMAIGLAVIYIICLLVRQFLEPKILSTQIGIHPLLTLFAMYLGYRTIGIFGMILGPVVALVAKNIFEKYMEKAKPTE